MRKNITKHKECSIVINTTSESELMGAVALINSIKEFSSSAVLYTIYVLFPDETKPFLYDALDAMQTENIKIIRITDLYKEFPNLPIVDKKLQSLLFPIMLKKVKTLLVLSPNTIVQADIADIFDFEFDDKITACCFDMLHKLVLSNRNVCFDTNVMLIDVKAWNLKKLTELCLSYISETEKEYNIMSLINLVCYDNIQKLDSRWNFQFLNTKEKFSDEEALKMSEAKIINFVADKPWKNPMMYKADLWWKYIRNTPVYETVMYKNIFLNLADAGYLKTLEQGRTANLALNLLLIDRLKQEVQGIFYKKKGNCETLERVINNDNLIMLMKKYLKAAFKYMFLYSKRAEIKLEMQETYENIINLMSETNHEK